MGNNHLNWFDPSKRKILILSFEEDYLKMIGQAISKINIEVNDAIGFKNDEVFYNKLSLKLYYLTTKNRHLWKHHFLGSQGLIMIFSFHSKENDERMIFEALNVFADKNIVGLPILVLVDINNPDQGIIEKLRSELNKTKDEYSNLVKFQYIDFENDINELEFGLEWLCETMKPLNDK
jgi:hypothetical protein